MKLDDFYKILFSNKIISSIIVIIISFIIYRLIKNIIFEKASNGKIKFMISSKSETYLKLVSSIIKYIFIIVTALVVLQINNVNVSGMLAGVGIVSVVLGLAVQDALKDIIRGFSILSDDYFSVGDVIKYNDVEGKVLVIGLKTTKVKSIINQNVVSIANRNIEKVEVVSSQLDIEVPLSYELSKKDAEKVILECVDNINKEDEIEASYKGINKLDSSSINYLIRIRCNPAIKPQIKRDSIGIIVDTLEKYNIEIPYTQIDIHNKKVS
ncbi:MAG: mechanosensitive ion channel family protein [Bacilli bacterium]|nr:mechanosensitive ion channel family protein [Bacilli bacterium]